MANKYNTLIAVIFFLIFCISILFIVNELERKNDKVTELRHENLELKNTIYNKNETIKELKSTIKANEVMIDQYRKQINNLQEKIGGDIKKETTLDRVKSILEETDIDENEYIEDDYNCVDFTYDLVGEFTDRGIYACDTSIYFDTGAHANVAVKTEEHGVVFIEPQNDEILMDMEEGEDYCKKAGWNCWQWNMTEIKHCFE